MEFETIASGLRFPEGPVVMADGSIIVVEIEKKCITRCWDGGKTEVIATPAAAPMASPSVRTAHSGSATMAASSITNRTAC
jgi:sugar lactone lactonase YvrE